MAYQSEISLPELQQAGPEQLESIYTRQSLLAEPKGIFAGEVLHPINPDRLHPLWRAVDWLGFELTPFGIDFNRSSWFFWQRSLQLGRFELRAGPSRWRETQTFGLHYHPSKLPLRALLYDEVKPLSNDLCLGIGGINTSQGAHFFFALHRPI